MARECMGGLLVSNGVVRRRLWGGWVCDGSAGIVRSRRHRISGRQQRQVGEVRVRAGVAKWPATRGAALPINAKAAAASGRAVPPHVSTESKELQLGSQERGVVGSKGQSCW